MLTQTKMLLTAIQQDGVQLFKELPAKFGSRTVCYPYLIKVGADRTLLRALSACVAIGDEIDVTLADEPDGKTPSMRLIKFTRE